MRVWVVSGQAAGTVYQAASVARKLVAEPVIKIVHRESVLGKWLYPFRQDSREVEPDIIISCGMLSERFVKAMKDAYGERPYVVHLQYPAPRHDCFDLVFASTHDWLPEFDGMPRVCQMLGVPHRVDGEKLLSARAEARTRWASDNARVITFQIGGPNKAYTFDDKTIASLASAVETLLAQGWTILATVSRRSPPSVSARLREITNPEFKLWNFEGENPYLDYMAAADAFLVTQDSISMACEASATGKPVYILPLSIKDQALSPKFERFHEDFRRRGISKTFRGEIENFTYEVNDETQRIASIVSERFSAFSNRG